MPTVESPSAVEPSRAPSGEAPVAFQNLGGSVAGPWRLLLAGLLGSFFALPWVAHFDERFPVENLSVEMTNRIRNDRNDPIAWAKERENRFTSLYLTAMVCLAGFGGAVGGMLGAAEGLARRSVSATAIGLFGGFLAGAVFAGAAGYSEALLLMNLEKSGLDRAYRAMLGHSLGWGLTAVGLSVAVALAARSAKLFGRVVLPAILAGALAALFYSPVAAVAFQLVKSDLPIPEGTANQFLFTALAAALMSSSIGRVRPSQLVSSGSPAGSGGSLSNASG